MDEHLILCGASVRAAAFSALRAGLRPWCVDLFADEDLKAVCEAHLLPMEEYPHGFVRYIESHAPPGPVMYTGGLENYPEVVERLARSRRLWACEANTLLGVRDPSATAAAVSKFALSAAAVRFGSANLPLDGSWLAKPRAGSGGSHIQHWRGQRLTRGRACYFQQAVPGMPAAAVYMAYPAGGSCRLLGVTRQLVGCPWLHAGPYAYCGSVGPLVVPAAYRAYEDMGRVLARRFGLRGLFGIDLVVGERADQPVLIEVNPRYTASTEIVELAEGTAALAEYPMVFTGHRVMSKTTGRPATACIGKAILFAPTDLVFPQEGPWLTDVTVAGADPWRLPTFADIPAPGTRISRGQPILTFFTEGADEAACLARLQATARDLDRRLLGG